MNLSLDDFSDDYIERMSSTTCPNCGLSSELATLLSRFENDHLRLDFRVIPKPLPVILYLSRHARDQSETFTWIKEWVAQRGQAGADRLREMLNRLRALEQETYGEERDSYGVLEECSEVLLEWRLKEDLRLENEGKGSKRRARHRPKP
jgi:hypothetical protein